MRSNRSSASRRAAVAGVLALVAISAAVWATPAGAVSASGKAVIITAEHDRGRTLSGQGGQLVAGEGTTLEGGKLTLPVPEVDPAKSTAGHSGNLAFRKGSRGVALAGVHFNFAAGTLDGLLGGEEMAVFKLGAQPNVNPVTGSVSLSEGELRLTADAAKVVRTKLGLKRALRRNGIGRIWISAQADPIQVSHTLSSGELDWGFLESWRSYILNVPPAGSVTVSGGATASGPLTSVATVYGFPVTGGTFVDGLYGASDRLTLTSGGTVKWAKPGHGINGIYFSNLEVRLDGTDSVLVGDVKTEFGPPAETADVEIATLDPSGVTPTSSADGKTVTWTAIPAKITADGAAPFGGFYEAGDELDPVTITAGIG